MQSFEQFLIEEQLDEAGLKAAFMDKVKQLSDKATTKAKKVLAGLDFERKETMFMLETFFKQLREILKEKKSVTEDDVKRALKQLRDVGKFSLIAPIFIMPGGGTTTAVLYMTGKKLFNISILPQGLEQVFEVVYDMKHELELIKEQEEMSMQPFSDYIKENNVISESLSRVYQHFNSNRPIGLVTAFRGEYPESENVKRNYELAKKVRAAGYGFIWVDGAWIENEGSDNEEHVSEVTLMVVGKDDQQGLRDHLVQWAKEYGQDAVVFKPADEQRIAYLLDKNNKVLETMRNQKFDQVAEIYTTLRRGNHAGRSFVLEAHDQKGFASAMAERAKRNDK